MTLSPHTDLTLLPEGAALLASSRTLVVADVHLGKSATFRARGLPVPEGDTARDLQRLLLLARKCGAAEVVIAGDLFHASSGMTRELESELARFIAELSVPVTLVAGNHDRKLTRLPASLRGLPHLDLGSAIRVIHDPAHAAGERVHVSGHLHPVVRIADGRRRSLRFPCFLFRGNTLVLPAFGSFTGGATVEAGVEDRVFVALHGRVVELPAKLIS